MEIAFISSNKVRAGVDSQKKGLTSRIINTFYSRQDMFISTMLVGNNIMLVVYGIGIAVLLEPGIKSVVGDNEALILVCQTIISTGIILITGEFLPKTIFRINPNISLRHCAVGLYVIYLVLYPISWLSSWLSKSLMHLFGAKASAPRSALLTVSELDDYIQQTIDDKNAGKTGAEEIEHEVKIFQNALDFSNTLLRDCMIPRNEIVAVSSDTDRERLRRRFTATGLSKILVYTDDIDNIIGYIHVNELFNTATEWQKCIKPVDFAPESMPANTMMRKMLAEKRSIAVIVDEFGGTGGLVTLEGWKRFSATSRMSTTSAVLQKCASATRRLNSRDALRLSILMKLTTLTYRRMRSIRRLPDTSFSVSEHFRSRATRLISTA